MPGTSRGRESGRAPIPPIEIGSFIAQRPDKSDFIGSASGVFFVNTVFRAFAAHSASSSSSNNVPDQHSGDGGPATAPEPDPGSAHSYMGGREDALDHVANQAVLDLFAVTSHHDAGQSSPPGTSYGIVVPGLGSPPAPAAARKLLMLYFRNWHAFFPFLHGPTFFDQVNHFYETRSDPNEDVAAEPGNLWSRLCRAVTLQCVFNIADSAQGCGGTNSSRAPFLEPSSRIQSTTALTSLLGAISSNPGIPALQALLAMELYLMTTMSLRAASTVHGALAQVIYHSGLHRCPFRYVQLPRDQYGIRQRIFWCAFVLDRHLSQALGHPATFRDDEVDVCVPGLVELHEPVKPSQPAVVPLSSSSIPGDEVSAHLPSGHSSRVLLQNGKRHTDPQTNPPNHPPGLDDVDEMQALDSISSPAHHHKTSPEEAGEYVLSYLATYCLLVGASLDLFHKSIHRRSITWDKVLELTCRIHSWWNGLPPALQDDEGDSNKPPSPYSGFFALSYYYLILFVNRPFLSLPTHRTDFRSSLQAALGASRSIIQVVRLRQQDPILEAWPNTLSATWMAGLVVAFASILGLYPREKATRDLEHVLELLNNMGARWTSARHCHAALRLLLAKLMSTRTAAELSASSVPASPPSDVAAGAAGVRSSNPPRRHGSITNNYNSSNNNSNKRRRYDVEAGPSTRMSQPAQTQSQSYNVAVEAEYPSITPLWQPVLEYMGPDFGYDAAYMAGRYEAQHFPFQNADAPESVGLLFNDVGWDAYVQNIGDRLSF
ncbi:hypothetical protein VTK73DRAFT_228 [Phialemonium thermophilum]|uniref:Xylanolytic transcriptional activator regulatory domain-containing protein n=1 Tax=Phialemonium thermophilum TaxID=223376 RepID=A0ABR3XG67_9PEZI